MIKLYTEYFSFMYKMFIHPWHGWFIVSDHRSFIWPQYKSYQENSYMVMQSGMLRKRRKRIAETILRLRDHKKYVNTIKHKLHIDYLISNCIKDIRKINKLL